MVDGKLMDVQSVDMGIWMINEEVVKNDGWIDEWIYVDEWKDEQEIEWWMMNVSIDVKGFNFDNFAVRGPRTT